MVLSDQSDWKSIVSPWKVRTRLNAAGERAFSSGQGPYSYDITMGTLIKVPNKSKIGVLDPKNIQDDDWVTLDISTLGYYDLDAHSSILVSIEEYLTIPEDCLAIFLGKSSYARCSVHPHITPGEPGWHGHLVIEISNMLHRPVRLYAGEGIAAMVLLRGEDTPTGTYEGLYQGQEKLTTTKV